MTKKQKRNLKRIIIALSCFLIVFTTNLILEKIGGDSPKFPFGLGSIFPNSSIGWLLPFFLFLSIYVYIGYDVVIRCVKNISHGQIFDENFLMVVATFGAFGLGIYNSVTNQGIEGFDEACAVLLFYQIGEWFQGYAVGKSRKSISSLMDIRPDYANLLKDGIEDIVSPEEVKVDDIIIVKPGEKVPLDGIVLSGSTTLDTKALTGESIPREITEGNEIISGCINLTSTIQVKVTKEFYDSTVSKILDLVENASSQKSKTENFITKFAKYYTPIVVFSALALALLGGLISHNWATWIYRALSFLVVSCPCALVISVPLSFFAGIGSASNKGILIKGSSYLEQFNKANIFVFDKTGTLTKGNFVVTNVYPENKKDEILRLASIAEQQSNHPIAISIKQAYAKEIDKNYTLTNVAGCGIVAKGNNTIYCGNEKLMKQFNINYTPFDGVGTVVYVAKDNEYVGSILICDEIKSESKQVILDLNSLDSSTIMLTGDNEKIANKVAVELGLSSYKSSLLPQDKVSYVEELLKNKKPQDVLCFVGDGINDAPVLMRSDIGISMGGVGSDAAIEASDIVLMHDDLKGIPLAKKIAKKTMSIVTQNIVFAIGIKLIILILSALGIANMWIAVFGDVGVAVIAILNAMRAMKIK